MIITGAVISTTGEYVLPHVAERRQDYLCPSCNSACILRRGAIKAPHFAHKSKQHCKYFEHPGESETHKHCKLLLAQLINQKVSIPVTIGSCHYCAGPVTKDIAESVASAVCEHPITIGEQRGIADIACLNSDGTVKLLIEILHTHKTDE